MVVYDDYFVYRVFYICKLLLEKDKMIDLLDLEGENNMKQFEIYEADLSLIIESEQGGIRPVIILQPVFNDMDRILCAPLTSKKLDNNTHIKINTQYWKGVYIMSDQLISIYRGRLRKKIVELSEEESQKVKDKLVELLK